MRVRFPAFRSLGPEPHDAMACSLWWTWHHDLLARREEVVVHPFATEIALVLRGRIHDRGSDPSLYRDGNRPPVRRHPWSECRGVRVRQNAWLSVAAEAEGDSQTAPVPARYRTARSEERRVGKECRS